MIRINDKVLGTVDYVCEGIVSKCTIYDANCLFVICAKDKNTDRLIFMNYASDKTHLNNILKSKKDSDYPYAKFKNWKFNNLADLSITSTFLKNNVAFKFGGVR